MRMPSITECFVTTPALPDCPQPEAKHGPGHGAAETAP